MSLCIQCGKREIFIKKRKLCVNCYQKLRNKRRLKDIDLYKYDKEIEFIKNYFNHSNWIYEPACFKIQTHRYTPDFYDGKQNVFIEVIGSRQAFHANKYKYDKFKQLYPLLGLEFRLPDGTELIKENGRYEWGIRSNEDNDHDVN